MANYGGKDASFTFNGHAITGATLTVSAISRQAVMEDVTPFGVTDEQWIYTGMVRNQELTFEGVYDDTPTTGTNAIFVGVGSSGSLVIGYGGTKTSTVTAFVRVYERIIKTFATTRYRATLRPSGAWVEA